MKRIWIFGFIVLLAGCQKLAELPRDFSVQTFKEWEAKKQATFINSLSPTAKREFIKVFLPGSYFVIDYNEVKFMPNGDMICDILRGRRDYISKPNAEGEFDYILGYWRLRYDEIVLQNPKRNERILFMSWLLILDNSFYKAEVIKNMLVLTFPILKSSGVETYGEIPFAYAPNPVESPAIKAYTEKVGQKIEFKDLK